MAWPQVRPWFLQIRVADSCKQPSSGCPTPPESIQSLRKENARHVILQPRTFPSCFWTLRPASRPRLRRAARHGGNHGGARPSALRPGRHRCHHVPRILAPCASVAMGFVSRHSCAARASCCTRCHSHCTLHSRQHRRLYPDLLARMRRCFRRINLAPQALGDILRGQAVASVSMRMPSHRRGHRTLARNRFPVREN